MARESCVPELTCALRRWWPVFVRVAWCLQWTGRLAYSAGSTSPTVFGYEPCSGPPWGALAVSWVLLTFSFYFSSLLSAFLVTERSPARRLDGSSPTATANHCSRFTNFPASRPNVLKTIEPWVFPEYSAGMHFNSITLFSKVFGALFQLARCWCFKDPLLSALSTVFIALSCFHVFE